MKAIWNNQTIAESNETIIVENNHYFPPESVNMKFLIPTETHTTCPWKGEASYFSLKVGEKTNVDAAWTYNSPSEDARHIKGYIAFWRGVEVIE